MCMGRREKKYISASEMCSKSAPAHSRGERGADPSHKPSLLAWRIKQGIVEGFHLLLKYEPPLLALRSFKLRFRLASCLQ